LESVVYNRHNLYKTTQNVFSPYYIYNQIRLERGCKRGTVIKDALELMQREGVVKFSQFGEVCSQQIRYRDRQLASAYKKEYRKKGEIVKAKLDTKTGKRYPSNLYNRILLSKRYDGTQKLLKTTTQLSIDIEHGRIVSTNLNEDADVKEIIIKNGSNIEFRKSYNTPNNIYIVIYGENVLITNEKLYNSFLIQALILNNYNRDYFTKVVQDNSFLILKIK
jgi:hypothetical protein